MMNRRRACLVEWLTVVDTGVQYAKQSGIPISVIEPYGYSPVARY